MLRQALAEVLVDASLSDDSLALRDTNDRLRLAQSHAPMAVRVSNPPTCKRSERCYRSSQIRTENNGEHTPSHDP